MKEVFLRGSMIERRDRAGIDSCLNSLCFRVGDSEKVRVHDYHATYVSEVSFLEPTHHSVKIEQPMLLIEHKGLWRVYFYRENSVESDRRTG